MQYYNKKVVGERIKTLRKKQRLTQNKLSELLDYTNERQLQRIENGETACSVDKLMEIAQILEVSTDYLLFGMESVRNDIRIGGVTIKNEKQRIFLDSILRTIVENMDLLYID